MGSGKNYPTSPRRAGGMFQICGSSRPAPKAPTVAKVTPQINPPIEAIKWLIKEAQGIFRRESNLLELEAPIKICGHFHG